MQEAEPVPIMCTLDGVAFSARKEDIASLTRRHLRGSRLTDRTLHLVYAPEAAAEVSRRVRLDGERYAFLSFALQITESTVELTITAPEQVDTDVTWLFEHSMLAGRAPCPSTPRPCGCERSEG